MNIRRTSALAALGLCTLVGVVAYRLGRARADGVPTASPLYYGGVLDDGGRPVEGMRNVTIRLWDMAMGGTAACTTVAPNTPFGAGRFRVEMDAACAAAVRANPNLWAEVLVDSTSFARTKLGAVPYALEAGRASGASGPLESRVAAVEALARPRQVVIGNWMFSAGSGYGTVPGNCSPDTFQTLSNPLPLTVAAASTGLYRVSATAGINPSYLVATTSPVVFRIDSPTGTAPAIVTSTLTTSSVVISALYRLTAGMTYTFVLQGRGGCYGTASALGIYSPLIAEQLN